MISRGEIKKCGFKPCKEEHLYINSIYEAIQTQEADWKGFMKSIPNGKAFILWNPEGDVRIWKVTKKEHEVELQDPVFIGVLPARYELQIILRCTGIA